jgi:hypothetical protein
MNEDSYLTKQVVVITGCSTGIGHANASQKNPMPAEEFAQKLIDEVTKKEAPRIVRLGSGVDSIVERAKLAGPELDRIMSERFKLDSLRKVP